jgi:hypothetical protein
MSDVQHTPGPWTIELYGEPDYPTQVIHSSDENRVCFMATAGSNGDPAMIEADAKLIAAAPDLLETLAWVRKNYAAGSTKEINERIDAVLAKAGA